MNPFRHRDGAPARAVRRRRGIAALEFALVAPLLAVLGLGVFDIVNALRVSLRLERTAGEVVNIVAQYETLREADMAGLFELASRVAAPLAVTGQEGTVILSGLSGTTGGPTVLWQRLAGGAGAASLFGAEGGAAQTPPTMPDFTLPANQGAVVVEVVLRREPWLLSEAFLRAPTFSSLRSLSVQRPRLVAVLRVTP